jgi:hypothetical protein
MHVGEPRTTEDLDAVRGLIRAFVAWHRERHRDDLHLIDAYFDAGAFEAELAGLPGAYEPLLLARVEGEPAGCVALKALDADTCEMKRLYEPYYELSPPLRDWLVFMELDLRAPAR